MADEVKVGINLIPSLGGISRGGGLGGAAAGAAAAGGAAAALTTIAAGVTALVAASKLLQNTLGAVVRTILLLFKPIGDLLAVALLPILFLLRPIAQFFNILMRPYIKKALEAMRLGAKLQRDGDAAGAAQAFGVGAAFVIKPFVDAMISQMSLMLQGLMLLFATIFDAVPGLGFVADAFRVAAMKVDELAVRAREFFDLTLLRMLDNVGQRAIERGIETEDRWDKTMTSMLEGSSIKLDDFRGATITELASLTTYARDTWTFADTVKEQLDRAEEAARNAFSNISGGGQRRARRRGPVDVLVDFVDSVVPDGFKIREGIL